MLSILLTTFNSAKYLDSAIKSILLQTFNNFEFIIVDDGSDDESEVVIKSFSDKRIGYFKIPHVGRSKALNYGLEKCNYEWVALIDADDIAHPERIEKQLKLAKEINDVVISSAIFFKERKLLFSIDVERLKFPNDLILHSKFPNSVIFNKKFILGNGGYNENLVIAEDYELWLRLNKKACFKILNEAVMFCNLTPNSLSRNNVKNTKSVIYGIQQKYYRNLKKYFDIEDVDSQNEFKGWREYFFGEPKLARKYWSLNHLNILKIRVLLAFFISILPVRIIDRFKSSHVKLRLKFIIGSVLGENKNIVKEFNNTIKLLNDFENENP